MEINKENIDKLVQYMNIELKKNPKATVNKLADKLGIKQSTFKTWAHRAGYQFDFENRCYTKELQKDKVLEEVAVAKEIEQPPSVIPSIYESIDINSLKELVTLLEPIKAMVEEHNRNKNIIDVKKAELNPPAVTELKQKLFKVDTQVLDNWNKFIEDHREYKVQSLISLALTEFIEKYK